jgi:hypothetical protein
MSQQDKRHYRQHMLENASCSRLHVMKHIYGAYLCKRHRPSAGAAGVNGRLADQQQSDGQQSGRWRPQPGVHGALRCTEDHHLSLITFFLPDDVNA